MELKQFLKNPYVSAFNTALTMIILISFPIYFILRVTKYCDRKKKLKKKVGVKKTDPDYSKKLELLEKLKEEGNKFFRSNNFPEAYAKYTEAINLRVDTPLNAIIFSNRALINLKLENNGLALADANEAIFWDPNYIKGYYRKANANLALLKLDEALKDFTTLKTKFPEDAYVIEKLEETKRLIEKKKEVMSNKNDDYTKLVLNSSKLKFDFIQNEINSTEIEASYRGPHLSEKFDAEWIKINIIELMKKDMFIHKKYLLQLIYKFIKLNSELPSLVEVTIPDDTELTICGDVHGQFYDLLNIFDMNGFPSEKRPYIFTGDFVDRGSFSVECIITLICFRLCYPNHFYMSRGNHENRSLNRIYGFENEVKEKYDDEVYEAFIELFHSLPLAHVVNGKILCLHGGLFSKDGVTLNDIKNIDRFTEVPDSGLMCELLWSDPCKFNGRFPNKRGVAINFGPDVANKFLDENGLELLIRSHEMKMNGYEVEGRVITIFSAPNYCDQMKNIGAFAKVKSPALTPEFVQFKEVKHPRAPNYTGQWLFL